MKNLLSASKIEVNVVIGQLDAITTSSGTVDWVDTLNLTEVKKGGIENIIVNKVYQGYYKEYIQLTVYSVWGSGRAVPTDNPETMEWILHRIIAKNQSP